MNMFWQHYLENKKVNFLPCIPKQVYAAILESSKNNDFFFRTTKPTLAKSMKFPWYGFCKTATARKKRRQVKMEGKTITCYHLQRNYK